jgi:hypothetical protein
VEAFLEPRGACPVTEGLEGAAVARFVGIPTIVPLERAPCDAPAAVGMSRGFGARAVAASASSRVIIPSI